MARTLVAHINKGLAELHKRTDHDRELIRQFRPFPEETRLKIKGLLHRFFLPECTCVDGNGPGHPYPVSEDQTKRKEIP